MVNKLLLGTSLLLIVLAPRHAAETLYAGKPLAFWLEELKSSDALIRDEAIEVLTEAGPAARAAVPRLEVLVKSDRPHLRIRAALALWRIAGQTKPAIAALTEGLRDRDAPHRAERLSQLGQFGGAAASSAPAVVELIDDGDPPVRTQVGMALQRFGAAAVPFIVPRLEDKDPRVRRQTCHALSLLGQAARDAVPKLTPLLKDADTDIRLEALATLGRLGIAAREAAPAIIELAHEKNIRVRAASLQTLQEVFPDPRLARPIASEALEDDDVLIRCRAVCLLWRVSPKHPDILPHTLELLKQPVGRGELLNVVASLGPSAARAVPVLTKLLDEVDAVQRRQIVQVLGRIGRPAQSAVPALLAQLQSPDFATRQEVVMALRAIRGDSERVVPALLDAAKKDVNTRMMCLPLLADYGSKASAAVPWLAEELRRPPSYMTVQLAETLHKIDPERARKDALPLLRTMLKPNNPWRVQAAMGLRRIEPSSEEALTALIDCVNGKNINARQQAIQFLGTLGKSAREAVPALKRALRDPVAGNRVAAADALWRITGDTETTVPVLIEALKPVPGDSGRYLAAIRLGEMGPAVKSTALPALRKYRDDPDPGFRTNVLMAIQRIEAAARNESPRPPAP
jgi:HEAT repeat protein